MAIASKFIDIYNLESFKEYDDIEKIKFVIIGDKLNIYCNDINIDYKKGGYLQNDLLNSDEFTLYDILDHFDRCIYTQSTIVKIKTNMKEKFIYFHGSLLFSDNIFNNIIFYAYSNMYIYIDSTKIKNNKERYDEQYLEILIKPGNPESYILRLEREILGSDKYTYTNIFDTYMYYFKINNSTYNNPPTNFGLKKLKSYSIPIYTNNKKEKHTIIIDYFHINKNQEGIYIINTVINDISGEKISIMQKNHCSCIKRSYIITSKIKDNNNLQDALSICGRCFYHSNLDKIVSLFKLSEKRKLYICYEDICKILNLKKSRIELVSIYL
jgi:hypothetical protein